jgi:hypothetical protein
MGLHPGLIGATEETMTRGVIALGLSQDLLMTISGSRSAFDSHNLLPLLDVRDQAAHAPLIPLRIHCYHLIKQRFGPAALLTSKVGLAHLGAHQFAFSALGATEPLGR